MSDKIAEIEARLKYAERYDDRLRNRIEDVRYLLDCVRELQAMHLHEIPSPAPLILKAIESERERCAKIAEQEPDGYAVQNCCICYGGNSFPGPMKEALKCDRSIIAAAIRQGEA